MKLFFYQLIQQTDLSNLDEFRVRNQLKLLH